ncbi:MAG: NAD-dependent epimerase/dehydratase family protein, partial [Betaproteobacteria bacterium]|nr:NAD-dependent epimerase/dehydratase family protein [Betaproteobacteria bacterium]
AAIIHLAAVVSGTAEANFDLGMRVNLDGIRNLLQAARAQAKPIRLLFASSIAVFGGELPEVVRDETTPTPQGSYGIQKYIGEQGIDPIGSQGFIAFQSRKNQHMGSQRLVGRKTLLKKRVPEHQEPLLMLRLSPTPAFGPKQTLPVAGTQRLAKRGIGRQPNQRLLIDQGCFIPHRTAGARLSRRRLRMHPIELRLGQGPSQPAKRVEHIMPAAMTAHSCGHLRMLIDPEFIAGP